MSENIDVLAREAAELKAVFKAIGMRNAFGITPEQQIDLDVAYRRAERDWMAAEHKYQAAIYKAAGGRMS